MTWPASWEAVQLSFCCVQVSESMDVLKNGNQRAAWLAKLVLCGNHIAIQSITLQNLFTSLITKVELQGWRDNQNLLSNVYDFNKTPQKDLS